VLGRRLGGLTARRECRGVREQATVEDLASKSTGPVGEHRVVDELAARRLSGRRLFGLPRQTRW
jgi:hypothetical protein